MFFERFNARQAQNRAAKQKPTLSVEEHAAPRAVRQCAFHQAQYSEQAEINVSGIFNKLRRYCADIKVGEWKATLENLDRRMTQDFPLYICEWYKIALWGSGYDQYYRSVLVPRFAYRLPNVDGKPVLNFDNLQVILTFNIAYDITTFPGERHRINLAGCYASSEEQEAPTDKQSKMMIVRHLATRRYMPAMAIKKLLFYAISTILTLALHDNIFNALSLTDAAIIFRSQPPHFKHYILLRWKKSITELSANEAILYCKLRDNIGQQSLDSGYERKWTPRFARRGAGNAANEEEKKSQLFRLFAYVSLTCNPRAMADIVPNERGKYRIEGHKNKEKIRQLTNKIQIKRAYYKKQDSRQQVRGEEEEECIEPVVNIYIPERNRLVNLLYYQPEGLTEDQVLEQRIKAIQLMVALCDKRETVKRYRV
ncbi:hypothetical protein DER44DRAFT_849720 [Fusarium oxysporum]|nr:hypothetical protein DER44DRAFT_849720 [Fusarium oxysporum]